MSISRVDSKKRVVLPNGRPGDVYDVRQENDDRVVLVRITVPEAPSPVNREACLKAMKEAPLSPTLSWEQLRTLTREP